MITRDSQGQIRFHYEEDDDEVASALKNILVNTEVGRDYKANYNTNATGAADYTKILNAAVTIAGGPMITEDIILHALTLLIDSGEIKSKNRTQAAQLAEPEEDTRPRSKDGRLLSQSQIEWGEMARFAETASMSEINLRKRSDPEFASFVRKNLEREMNEQPIGDAVVNQNQSTAPKKKTLPADVVAFATRYRTMSTADIKRELSPGMNPLGPAAAAEANRLFEASCAAGLI